MTIVELLGWVKDAGAVGLAVLILFGGYKGIWVWGWQLDAERREKEVWRSLAEKAADIADKSTPALPPPPTRGSG